jgi:hypothetical protein
MHRYRDPCTTETAMKQSTKNITLAASALRLLHCFRSAGPSKAASRCRSRARKHGSVARLLQSALPVSRAGNTGALQSGTAAVVGAGAAYYGGATPRVAPTTAIRFGEPAQPTWVTISQAVRLPPDPTSQWAPITQVAPGTVTPDGLTTQPAMRSAAARYHGQA